MNGATTTQDLESEESQGQYSASDRKFLRSTGIAAEEAWELEEARMMELAAAQNTFTASAESAEEDQEDGDAEAVTATPAGEKRGPRINLVEAVLMVAVSLFFDGAQTLLGLIPVVGIMASPLIMFFAWLTFFIWFHAKGMSYGSLLKQGRSLGKNPMVINLAMLIIGFTPLALLPERTMGIVLIIIFEYAEHAAKGSDTVRPALTRKIA